MARYQVIDEETRALSLIAQTICNDIRHVALNDKLAIAEARRKFGKDAEVSIDA